MRTTYLYIIKTLLILLAISFLVFHINDLFHWYTVPIVMVYLALGFWFGKITCSFHSKKTGFWVTVFLFIFLNLFHSLIDGATLINLSTISKNIAIYSHELLRQPALYVVFWSMLHPFEINTLNKIVLSLLAITGIWIIGMYGGVLFGNLLQQLGIPETFFNLALFIFIGDIAHHLYDEFPGKKHVH